MRVCSHRVARVGWSVLDSHSQRRGVTVPDRQGGWLGVARARTLSRATLATALPLSRSLPFSIRLPWCMRVFLHRSRSCHPRGVIVDLVAMRNVAPRRRLSDGAGARASSSCSPLVGATLLLVMGRPCRSNAARVCVHSALAGALLFGGARSCRVARRRGWLSGYGGVA